MRYTTRIIVPPRIRRSGLPGTPGGAYGPQVLGVRRTLGLGDRLGMATAGHLAVAARYPGFVPVLAQSSPAETMASGRTLAEGLNAVTLSVGTARFRQPWGADADRLRTAQEAADAAEAGFTYFTLEASDFLCPGVADLPDQELAAGVNAMVEEGVLSENWTEPYLDRTIDLPGGHRLQITLPPLQRAALRYGAAVQHGARLASAVARSCRGRPFEIEVSLDAADTAASPLEHLFVGLELESRGVRLTSLALRLNGPHTPVHPDTVEQTLREHAAVADFCGPYKLCFHGVTEDWPLLPLIGRTCGEALHVKVDAVSYLEALRMVAEVDPDLFRQVATISLGGEADRTVLDQPEGKRRLNANSGTVLPALKQPIREMLDRHADLYAERLSVGYGRIIEPLLNV